MELERLLRAKTMILHIMKITSNWIKTHTPGESSDIHNNFVIIRWILTQKLKDNSRELLPLNTHKNLGLYKDLKGYKDVNYLENLLQQMCACYKYNYNLFKLQKSNLIVTSNSDNIVYNYDVLNYEISIDRFNTLAKAYKGKKLNDKIFNVLVYYNMFEYNNMNTSLPPEVFQILKEKINLETEFFASPLCHTLDNYCSPYLNTDKYFGSKGDFFEIYKDLFKNGGSFEANPPVTEEHLSRTTSIILKELKENEHPLSFVMMVPSWSTYPFYKSLMNSSYLVYVLYFHKGEYAMKMNNNLPHQKIKKDKFYPKHTSLMFFLQNEKGRKKYLLNEELFKSVIKAFNDYK